MSKLSNNKHIIIGLQLNLFFYYIISYVAGDQNYHYGIDQWLLQ